MGALDIGGAGRSRSLWAARGRDGQAIPDGRGGKVSNLWWRMPHWCHDLLYRTTGWQLTRLLWGDEVFRADDPTVGQFEWLRR